MTALNRTLASIFAMVVAVLALAGTAAAQPGYGDGPTDNGTIVPANDLTTTGVSPLVREDSDGLAFTGSDLVIPLIIAGLALLVVGLAFVLSTRRSRAQS